MTYFKKEFGRNLRLIRKAKGLTQEKLAEMINLNQRQLTRIENGVSFVSSDVIEKLSIALNIEIKELFDFNIKNYSLEKTGTEPQYRVIQSNNVISIQKFNSKDENNKNTEKVINESPDKYLLKISKELNKPITAQHLHNDEITATYIYKPDGSIECLEKEIIDNKTIDNLFNKIKKLTKNEKQLKYIELAIDSLSNKNARKELKTLINGMELLE